jgi:protein-ribulosamine 3-kinase
VTDTHPLSGKRIQASIGQIVSEHRRSRWALSEFRDMNEFSSHPSAILSDGSYPVFVKFSTAENGLEQFRLELEGLRLLSDLAGVLIPTPIANITVEGGVVLILEGVQAVDRTAKQWQDIGRALVQVHQIKGQQFGLDTHNYFGPLYQDNRPMDDWPAFYTERRLWPRFMGAINARKMPTAVIRMVETLIHRLPALCGPDVVPTLLHGDAQQNNFISTGTGAVVIDPAVYYGHPEMDLAYIDYFQPVPDEVLDAYREILPVDPGFRERRELWRIYGYLAAVEVEGAAYLPRLTDALRKYI